MNDRHAWTDVLEEVTGGSGGRAPSPWDVLSLVSRSPGPNRTLVQPEDVGMEVSLGSGDDAPRLKGPFVLSDDSSGQLSPHARLAMVQAAARTGYALRLSDPDPALLELAQELGVALWLVLGPRRTASAARAMRVATVVELLLMEVGPDGGLVTSVDGRDDQGSIEAVVTTARSVSGDAFVMVNTGPAADRETLRQAILSGADGVAVRARSRCSIVHPQLVGPDPISAVAATFRVMSRTKRPKGAPEPKLVAQGGFKDGIEVVKAMALGADMVVMGTAPRISMGCTLCGECGPGECPKGSTSDWRKEAESLVGYLKRLDEQTRLVLAQMGCASVREASPVHLEARTYDAAAVTGAPLAGYGETLPMWLH